MFFENFSISTLRCTGNCEQKPRETEEGLGEDSRIMSHKKLYLSSIWMIYLKEMVQ